MRRALVVLTLLLGVGLLLGGCAGIPSSGSVEQVADDTGPDQTTVRYEPVGPPRDASPQQIVRGYLDAMLAYPVSTGTAASYLTPKAERAWKSSEGVSVYTTPEVTLPSSIVPGRDEVDVVLRADDVAQLDRQGHYAAGSGAGTRTYELRRVEGQWRIANPQDGVMVTRTYYTDYFRPFPIYYFDSPGKRLVPDLVHLAVGDQLPTGLVTSLARGPRGISSSLRTYVPGAGALRPSVTVGADDVADVEFSSSLGNLATDERDRLAAQIVWTLRSLDGVQGVRIRSGGSILTASGNRVQPVGAWDRFGPRTGDSHTYVLRDDKLAEVDGTAVRPVTGGWGKGAMGAVEAAVDDDAVAAVLADRRRVRVTDRNGSDPRVYGGAGLLAPRWDDRGRLWLLDRPDGATRVRIVDDQRAQVIPADGLTSLRVRSFAVSPDGGRFAVTATEGDRTSVFVGSVLRDADDRVTGLGDPRRLDTGVGNPHSVEWQSMTRVVFLGDSEIGVQLYDAAVDGTNVAGGAVGGGPLLPDVGATSLAGGEGVDAPRWVTDARRRLWYLPPGGSWQLLDDGSYTALSTGG